MSKREFTKYPHHVDPYKKHRITDEELDFLQELQKEMNTQNTWAQADPRIWVIQELVLCQDLVQVKMSFSSS